MSWNKYLSFNANRDKKVTYTQNQKESGEISSAHQEEKELEVFYIHSIY